MKPLFVQTLHKANTLIFTDKKFNVLVQKQQMCTYNDNH